WVRGAPNNAISPSPVKVLTVPSNRSISRLSSSKHPSIISRTVSASKRSDSGVKPTRSVKSTVTCLRSPSRNGGGDAVAGLRRVPHWGQKRFSEGFEPPQDGQVTARPVPQPPQNGSPRPTLRPQLGHSI